MRSTTAVHTTTGLYACAFGGNAGAELGGHGSLPQWFRLASVVLVFHHHVLASLSFCVGFGLVSNLHTDLRLLPAQSEVTVGYLPDFQGSVFRDQLDHSLNPATKNANDSFVQVAGFRGAPASLLYDRLCCPDRADLHHHVKPWSGFRRRRLLWHNGDNGVADSARCLFLPLHCCSRVNEN